MSLDKSCNDLSWPGDECKAVEVEEDEEEEDEEETEDEDDIEELKAEAKLTAEKTKDAKKSATVSAMKKSADVVHSNVDDEVDLTDKHTTHWISFKTVLAKAGIREPFSCHPLSFDGEIEKDVLKGLYKIASHLVDNSIIAHYTRKHTKIDERDVLCVCILFEEWPAAATFIYNKVVPTSRDPRFAIGKHFPYIERTPFKFHANTKHD